MAEVRQSPRINGVLHVIPDVHGDERGSFQETYRREWFDSGREMVQGSRSDKQPGALVGLHFHLKQSDYWYVVNGTARVALYDLRQGSATQGQSDVFLLGDENNGGVFIPPGVGHGFVSVTAMTLTYLVDGYYDPDDEFGVAWDDPALGIDWGIESPVISDRDRANPKLADLGPVAPILR